MYQDKKKTWLARKLKVHMVLKGHKRRMFSLLVSKYRKQEYSGTVAASVLFSTINHGSVSSLHVPQTTGKRTKEGFKSFHFNLCKTRNLVWPREKSPHL